MTRCFCWLLLLGAWASAACSRASFMREAVLGVGDPCAQTADCRVPLVCGQASTCQPSHAVPRGSTCALSADCEPGLYCAQGACAEAGSGPPGATCASSADCGYELFCAFEGMGGTCRPGGEADLGDPCSSRSQCMAGLLCDPQERLCVVRLAAPAGDSCTFDGECDPEVGLICTAARVCGGRGPDGELVLPWTGVVCPASPESGSFRIPFEVANAGPDFFRLPFPNNIRRRGGRIDLTTFPRPPLYAVPTDLVGRYLDAVATEHEAFAPSLTVFFRFTGRPLFCDDGCEEQSSCDPDCIGRGERADPVYVVDLGTGAWQPVAYRWSASHGSRPYLCGPWLAVFPQRGSLFDPGHTYAVFIHSRIKADQDSRPGLTQDRDFEVMLQTDPPATEPLLAAWTEYAPLRAWLSTSPAYPASDPLNPGAPVAATDLAAAAVFTIRDPTRLFTAVAGAVAAEPEPTVTDLITCTSGQAAPDCSNPVAQSFVEVQGEIALPVFQEGEPPYQQVGGGMRLDSNGLAEVQRHEAVRFALSIPKGLPASGLYWPLVIYAHGTGGDFRSHIREGLAEAFATGPVRAAVLGIDQVGHGPRRGDSELPPEVVFFNWQNPAAARGNTWQAAADQVALLRGVANLSRAVRGLNTLWHMGLDSAKIAFLGHSQGGNVGVLAMAAAPGTRPVALSGAGAGLIDTFQSKTSPYNLSNIMRLVLADPTLDEPRIHPALTMVQAFLEDADPVNYGRSLAGEPLAGGAVKHVLQIIGVDDTYSPTRTGLALAQRLVPWTMLKLGAGVFVDDDDTGLGTPVAVPPLRANVEADSGPDLTVAVSLHKPTAGRDGHFVLFDRPMAKERLLNFVGNWFRHPDLSPAVEP